MSGLSRITQFPSKKIPKVQLQREGEENRCGMPASQPASGYSPLMKDEEERKESGPLLAYKMLDMARTK